MTKHSFVTPGALIKDITIFMSQLLKVFYYSGNPFIIALFLFSNTLKRKNFDITLGMKYL